MLDFKGKNILIVGASSGIGYELAKTLIASGANVISASRNAPPDLAVKHLTFDLLTDSGSELASIPQLDGVAYCVGSINLKPFGRLSQDDFLKDYQLNVLGAVKVIQQTINALKKSDTSSVVLFSTVAVAVGMNYHASIAAAKGAVEGLAKSLAAEFAVNKVRFNVIAPSLTDTPLAKNLLSSPEKKDTSAKRHPLGRVGIPSDIASAAAFLLSDQASWVSGQVIGIDGGMSTLKPL
ncbi:MAG: SDR family oxidoreductase [Cytophagales bacterium]|nr:MAG: SDR family oxidoreductase [Cytophagales bacterium]